MPNLKQLAQFVGLGLATMGLVACGGGGTTEGGNTLTTQSGTGLMSLAVTDAPIDGATRVVIRFTHVELQPVDDGERVVIYFDEPALVEEPVDPDPPEEGTETVLEIAVEDVDSEPKRGAVREIDLLTLQGENSEPLFDEVEVPAGDYAWIRFYLEPEPGPSSPPLSNFLTSSYIEFEVGDRANLIIPGGLQAGLQLVSGFTVPEGGSVAFTVDFDLRNMIRPDSRFEGYYRMRRALRLVDNSTVGVITGTVAPALFPENYTCDENTPICPGLSVFVHNAGGTEPEPGSDPDEGGDAIVIVSSVEEPLTTANVVYEYVDASGQWEHRYTAAFLSEGAYNLALTLESPEDVFTVLGDAVNDVPVVAGEKTIVDFE